MYCYNKNYSPETLAKLPAHIRASVEREKAERERTGSVWSVSPWSIPVSILEAHYAEELGLADKIEANLDAIQATVVLDKNALKAAPQDLLEITYSAVSACNDGWRYAKLVRGEIRRRHMNEARERNTAARAAVAVDPNEYKPGDKVEVHAFGHWYRGTVVRLATKGGKVLVSYILGTGVTREKLVGSDLVRKGA